MTTATRGTEKSGLALAGPAISIVLGASAISLSAVSLPAIQKSFPASELDPSLVVSIYIVAVTSTLIPIGRLGDRIGSKQVLLTALVIFACASLCCAYANSLGSLIALRSVQGMSGAALMAMPLAQVRATVPPERLGRWMGIMGSLSAIGTASGPAVGGTLIEITGWPSTFFALVPLSLLAAGLTWRFFPKTKKEQEGLGLDLLNVLLLALSLSALVFMISSMSAGLKLSHIALCLAAVVSGFAFFARDGKSPTPLVDTGRLSDRALFNALLCNCLVSIVMMGILVVGPFFLISGLGLTNREMGLYMSIGPITAIVAGVPSGRLTEIVGAQITFVLGLCLLAAGCLFLAALPLWIGLAGFAAGFFTLAGGYQCFLAALNTEVMRRAGPNEHGAISALLNVSRNLGFAIGATSLSTVFTVSLGLTAGEVSTAFMTSCGVSLCLLVICFWIKTCSPREAGTS